MNGMSDFEQRINTIASRIASSKLSASSGEEETPVESFRTEFVNVTGSIVNPVVHRINQVLEPVGSAFDIITSDPSSSNGYIFTQIVYHNASRSANLLSDPYLLLEGYPAEGKIRIAEGLSTQSGAYIPIGEVNQSVMEESLMALLEKQV